MISNKINNKIQALSRANVALEKQFCLSGPNAKSECVCVWGCVCIKLMTIKYTNTITNVDTHAHSHARQVIQISKANSEPGREPDPKPETEPSPSARQQDCANILPATETKTYYYRMLPMCGWVCVCVCLNWIWFIEIWYFPWYEHCKSSKHEPGTETRRVWQTQEQSTWAKKRERRGRGQGNYRWSAGGDQALATHLTFTKLSSVWQMPENVARMLN